MADINYEEGYFKLKKSNEDLTTLINKVINDFKQTKSQLSSEKDKNNILSKRNTFLEKQVFEVTSKCDAYQQELGDLRDEMVNLRTYSKAVEGVAETYCGKNMVAEKKYKQLRRKSTMILTQFALDKNLEISLDDPDEIDSNLTPTADVPDLGNIKKSYEEKLSKEKIKKKTLRDELQNLKAECEEFKKKIEQMDSELNEKSREIEKSNCDMEVLTKAYDVLKTDHENMMECFQPYLKMKSENIELKKISGWIYNDEDGDARIVHLTQKIEELKIENSTKDGRIKELQKECDSTDLTIEISTLKLQLEDASDKINAFTKEIDTVKHENRILKEQKGGPGIAPPPPPMPPPPPPPPSTSKMILNLFKGKSKSNAKKNAVTNPDDQKLADLMGELQRRLEKKVRNERFKDSGFPLLNSQESFDSIDFIPKEHGVKLRSASVPNITPMSKETSELQSIFLKRKIAPIDENN